MGSSPSRGGAIWPAHELRLCMTRARVDSAGVLRWRNGLRPREPERGAGTPEWSRGLPDVRVWSRRVMHRGPAQQHPCRGDRAPPAPAGSQRASSWGTASRRAHRCRVQRRLGAVRHCSTTAVRVGPCWPGASSYVIDGLPWAGSGAIADLRRIAEFATEFLPVALCDR